LPLWQAVALKLYNEGYKVAVASRSRSDPTQGKALPLKVDVTKENDIVSAFKQVEKSLGAPPNLVVYNGMLFNCAQSLLSFFAIVAVLSSPPVANDPFSLPYTEFLK
jgi:NAD(P)-dependent dehydrogenase (short-subunit alcohol dehydrogenase family)